MTQDLGVEQSQALEKRYEREPKRSKHGENSACIFSSSVLY